MWIVSKPPCLEKSRTVQPETLTTQRLGHFLFRPAVAAGWLTWVNAWSKIKGWLSQPVHALTDDDV